MIPFLEVHKTKIIAGVVVALVLGLGWQTLRVSWLKTDLIELEGKYNLVLQQIDEQNRKIDEWKSKADRKQKVINALTKENEQKRIQYDQLLTDFNNQPVPDNATCDMAITEARELFNELSLID